MKKNKKKIKKTKIDIYFIFLISLSVLFLASLVRYMLRTYQIPQWDEQYYMQMATSYYRLLQHPTFSTPYDLLQIEPVKQPGYPLFILPFLLLFGLSQSYFWAIFTNGLFYIASIFGVYFVSKYYFSKLSAFTAAVIFAFYGWTLYYVNQAYTETATTAFCIWTVYSLIKSDYLQKRNYSLLFGLFLAIGLLIRWASVIFVAGAILYVLFIIFKKNLFRKKSTLINGASAFFVALLIPVYPYLTNWYWVGSYFNGHRFGGPMWQIIPQQERDPFSLYSLTFYFSSFEKLGIIYFLLIIFGIILAIRKKNTLKLIFLTAVVPWIFFSLFSILKADRFIVPIYPFLAILSASVFDFIKNKFYRISFIILVMLLSIGTFFGSVWGKGPMKANLATVSLPFNDAIKIHVTTISHPPDIYKKTGREIVDYILKDSKAAGIKQPKVTSLFYYRPLDEPLMTYNLYTQKEPLQINNYLGTVITNPDKESEYLIKDLFKNSNYLLMKNGQTTDTYFSDKSYTTLRALIVLFKNYIPLREYYKEKTKIWIYQDSSTVTVFKKNKNISEEELESVKADFITILKQINDQENR